MGGNSGQRVRQASTPAATQITSSSIMEATKKIESLPSGKLFDDAKRIDSIFKKSEHSYSETIESFEKNKDLAVKTIVPLSQIEITQPNIQSNKVIKMIPNLNDTPIINVVQFRDGTKAIYDGHHRLLSNWALGNNNILVNLVKL